MKGGYFEEIKNKTCLGYFTLSYIIPCVFLCCFDASSDQVMCQNWNERKDIQLIGCV